MSGSFQDASTSQAGSFAYPIASGNQGAENAQQQASGSGTQLPQSRQAAEEARKDRTLAEFMLLLDDYEPLVRVGVLGLTASAMS
jgi:hypothetical protein